MSLMSTDLCEVFDINNYYSYGPKDWIGVDMLMDMVIFIIYTNIIAK